MSRQVRRMETSLTMVVVAYISACFAPGTQKSSSTDYSETSIKDSVERTVQNVEWVIIDKRALVRLSFFSKKYCKSVYDGPATVTSRHSRRLSGLARGLVIGGAFVGGSALAVSQGSDGYSGGALVVGLLVSTVLYDPIVSLVGSFSFGTLTVKKKVESQGSVARDTLEPCDKNPIESGVAQVNFSFSSGDTLRTTGSLKDGSTELNLGSLAAVAKVCGRPVVSIELKTDSGESSFQPENAFFDDLVATSYDGVLEVARVANSCLTKRRDRCASKTDVEKLARTCVTKCYGDAGVTACEDRMKQCIADDGNAADICESVAQNCLIDDNAKTAATTARRCFGTCQASALDAACGL